MNNEKEMNDKGMLDFEEKMKEKGLGCGIEIAKLAKEIHPNAIAIIPLYRSCLVIEQSKGDKKNGMCTIHSYADPHWLGKDINVETLKSVDFHKRYFVLGMREGVDINRED